MEAIEVLNLVMKVQPKFLSRQYSQCKMMKRKLSIIHGKNLHSDYLNLKMSRVSCNSRGLCLTNGGKWEVGKLDIDTHLKGGRVRWYGEVLGNGFWDAWSNWMMLLDAQVWCGLHKISSRLDQSYVFLQVGHCTRM